MQEAKLALKITVVLIVVGVAIALWAGVGTLPKWLQPGHYQYGGEFKR